MCVCVCVCVCVCCTCCVYVCARACTYILEVSSLRRVRSGGLEQISWYLVEWVSLRTPSQPFILGSSGPRLCLCPLLVVLSRPRARDVSSFIPGCPLLAFLGSVSCVCVRLTCPKAIRRCWFLVIFDFKHLAARSLNVFPKVFDETRNSRTLFGQQSTANISNHSLWIPRLLNWKFSS